MLYLENAGTDYSHIFLTTAAAASFSISFFYFGFENDVRLNTQQNHIQLTVSIIGFFIIREDENLVI